MAQFFSIHPENPQRRLIHQAVEIIRAGGVIAYPTDSSYALGCAIGNSDAMKKIRRIRRVGDDDNFTLVRYHSGDSSEIFDADNAWQLTEIPGGFWRESVLRRKRPGSDLFVQQMVYTDGLASLSIFIEKKTDLTQSGVSSMGAVNAFIRVLNDHSVTAIGEVPAITVRQVAESVSFQPQ